MTKIGKNACLQCGDVDGFNLWSWERSLELEIANPTQYFLPRKFHGQRRWSGYSLWGCKGLDTTRQTSPYDLPIATERTTKWNHADFLAECRLRIQEDEGSWVKQSAGGLLRYALYQSLVGYYLIHLYVRKRLESIKKTTELGGA